MWKRFSTEGFTFIEVSIALLVLFAALGTFIPIGTKIYLERLTIREQYEALEFLNERLLSWRFENASPIHKEISINETTYYLSFSSNSETELTLCLEWIGRNNRSYKQCSFANK